MITKVKQYIRQFHMLSVGDRIVVGVSGGADSMCLLKVLMSLKQEYQLTLFVVHVNHMLRGNAADKDEAFVVDFCNKNGIPVKVEKRSVRELAKVKGWSEEEAGRNVRYAAFYEECERQNANKIAVAHNKNDNAETVLLNLFRGSGIYGMSGMRPMRGQIIRPLLHVTRIEIEDYLSKQNISYCTDESNFHEDYTRNKVRLSVLPYVEQEINHRATEHIVSMADQLTEVAHFIDKVTMEAYNRIVMKKEGGFEIESTSFNQLDITIQKNLVRKAIFLWKGQLKDIEEGHIMDVIALLSKQVGKYIHLPYGIVVKRAYTSIAFYTQDLKGSDVQSEVPLPCYARIPGNYEVKGYSIHFDIIEYKKSMRIPKNGYTKWFDYDKIKTAVVIRTRQMGDYLQFNKQGGTKSLKSVFIDNKIPSEIRDEIPLICDGSHVMWILGGRTSEGYRIEESTKTVLVVNIKKLLPVQVS